MPAIIAQSSSEDMWWQEEVTKLLCQREPAWLLQEWLGVTAPFTSRLERFNHSTLVYRLSVVLLLHPAYFPRQRGKLSKDLVKFMQLLMWQRRLEQLTLGSTGWPVNDATLSPKGWQDLGGEVLSKWVKTGHPSRHEPSLTCMVSSTWIMISDPTDSSAHKDSSKVASRRISCSTGTSAWSETPG